MCQGCSRHFRLVSVVPRRGDKGRPLPDQQGSGVKLALVKRSSPAIARVSGRRRAVKVLYPAQVHMYLPPQKKDWVKRMLFILLSIVAVQVLQATEDNEDLDKSLALPTVPVCAMPLLPTNGSALQMPSGADNCYPTVRSQQWTIVEVAGQLSKGNGSSPNQDFARELPNPLRITFYIKSGSAPKFSSPVQ